MPTIDQTSLDNGRADLDDLASFMNDAAGDVVTRTGGTVPNLRSLIDTVTDQLVGTEVFKTTAGDVTVTTERKVLVKKTSPQATGVTFPLSASRVGLPITVGNLGTSDYVAFPTTVSLTSPNTFDDGTSSYVMDATGQIVTFWPMPDNTGYYKG